MYIKQVSSCACICIICWKHRLFSSIFSSLPFKMFTLRQYLNSLFLCEISFTTVHASKRMIKLFCFKISFVHFLIPSGSFHVALKNKSFSLKVPASNAHLIKKLHRVSSSYIMCDDAAVVLLRVMKKVESEQWLQMQMYKEVHMVNIMHYV